MLPQSPECEQMVPVRRKLYFVGSRDWRSVWRHSFLLPMSRIAATIEAGSGMVEG
jgi:hypothetical protein